MSKINSVNIKEEKTPSNPILFDNALDLNNDSSSLINKPKINSVKLSTKEEKTGSFILDNNPFVGATIMDGVNSDGFVRKKIYGNYIFYSKQIVWREEERKLESELELESEL